MPMFKVKDLMINVGDTPQALCLHTTVCGICSVGGSICQCSVAVTKVCQDCTIAISQLCANCSIYISKVCQTCSVLVSQVCRQETITNCYDCSFAVSEICQNQSVCPGGSIVCPGGSGDPWTPVEQLSPIVDTLNHEGLAALKAQLKVINDKVDAQQAILDKQFAPQTLEDANLLEEKLNAALTEVRAMKGQFKKSSK